MEHSSLISGANIQVVEHFSCLSGIHITRMNDHVTLCSLLDNFQRGDWSDTAMEYVNIQPYTLYPETDKARY